MLVVRGRNVNEIFPFVIQELLKQGVKRGSRNGPVIMFSEPVTTVYDSPAERVLFSHERDANPFFHLAEALWMLAGRNDVATVARYVKRMADFSDDGVTFHGAYGHRWRKHFNQDQLTHIINGLKADPDSRRQVLAVWDPKADLNKDSRDLPCNTQAVFQIACDGRLDMMVSNRSNDIIWGAYGANAVHFSVLHEYMALSIGVPQGRYRQVSANFHAYESVLEKVCYVKVGENPYLTGEVAPFPLMSTPRESWDKDLLMYMKDPFAIGFKDPFFRRVAAPMARSYTLHKNGKEKDAMLAAESISATDWRKACVEWLLRRSIKKGENNT